MPTATDTPADTTIMRIVHNALRRDLARASTALADPGRLDPRRRQAIGGHLAWMVDFLHAHHASEDNGLYPLLRTRAAGAADRLEVLDRMERQHEAIAPAAHEMAAAGRALGSDPSDAAVVRAAGAVAALVDALIPHLRQEEDEAMPITSELITAAEWQAIEKEHNLDPKSMRELGFEGHWLIDEASEADRATVVGLVPPVVRSILLHGFARRYRRYAVACWGSGGRPGGRPPRRVQLANRVSVAVPAGIDDVWDLVRDVTRVGEWSHECVAAHWLDGATGAVPGARFRGGNRAGAFRWQRVCEIVSAEPYELVWRTVSTAFYPDRSEWRISLEPAGDGGTRITQSFQVLRAPRVLSVLYAFMVPGHRDRTAKLTEDLQRLGAAAARSAAC